MLFCQTMWVWSWLLIFVFLKRMSTNRSQCGKELEKLLESGESEMFKSSRSTELMKKDEVTW